MDNPASSYLMMTNIDYKSSICNNNLRYDGNRVNTYLRKRKCNLFLFNIINTGEMRDIIKLRFETLII